MIHLTHDYAAALTVVEYDQNGKPKHQHRVIAFAETGAPLIPGRKGLIEPPFQNWLLVDADGPDYSAVERRAHAALDRLMGAGR